MKYLAILLISVFAIFTPSLALAQQSVQTWDGQIVIQDNTSANNVSDLASKLIVWMLAVIALVATIVIIYAGILLVFNGGSEARVAQAKKTLTWAIVGLVVAVAAFAIVSIIQGVLS